MLPLRRGAVRAHFISVRSRSSWASQVRKCKLQNCLTNHCENSNNRIFHTSKQDSFQSTHTGNLQKRSINTTTMAPKKVISTNKAPAPIKGIYSQAIVANGTVYCSGSIAMDPATNEIIPGGVQEHTVSFSHSTLFGDKFY